MRRWPRPQRCWSACWTPSSLSNTTSPAGATPGSASPIVTVGQLARDRGPAAAGRPDRDDDETVDALVDEPLRELELARGLAVGVGDERAALGAVELALDGADELLRPEVGEAADQQRRRRAVAPPASARAIGSAS